MPGDKDALLRLEGLLERAGDHAGLVQTLEYHAEHAGSPDERVRLVSRAAEMLENTLGDAAGAAERWEEVVTLDPDDARALGALAAIYGRLDRYEDLARVLDAQIERLVADPPQQAEHQRRLAELCEGPLGDVRRAEQAWRALLETLPSDVQALESLARIYSANEDWPTLARILERQIPYAADPERAVELALRRAALLDEKLDSPKEAAYMLEQVVGELDPRSWDAHERLRDLYERDGDWPKVVKIAERQLFLTEAAPDRMARAMEVGTIWRDRLRDEHKAITAFERALEIDPHSVEAMQALAPLYQSVRDWEHLIALSERLLEETESPEDRHRLHLEIAVILEQHLQDPKGAFDWYRRAYTEQPDAESLHLLDSVAEKHSLFEDLIAVYDGIRTRADEPSEQLAAALKIASICETRLGDPPARVQRAARRPARRSRRPRAADDPGTARLGDRGVERHPGRVRPHRAGPHRARRAGRVAAPARRGARKAAGRSARRTRRAVAQLRRRPEQRHHAG